MSQTQLLAVVALLFTAAAVRTDDISQKSGDRPSGIGLELEFDWVVDAPEDVPRQFPMLVTAGKSSINNKFRLLALERDGGAPELVSGPFDATEPEAVASLLSLVDAFLIECEKAFDKMRGENQNVPLLPVLDEVLANGHLTVNGIENSQLVLSPGQTNREQMEQVVLHTIAQGANLQSSFEVGCDKINTASFSKLFAAKKKHWGYVAYVMAKKLFAKFGTDERLAPWFILSFWSRIMFRLWKTGEFDLIGLSASDEGVDRTHLEYKNEYQLMPRIDSFALLSKGQEEVDADLLERAKALIPSPENIDEVFSEIKASKFTGYKFWQLRIRNQAMGKTVDQVWSEKLNLIKEVAVSFGADLPALTATRTESELAGPWEKMNTYRDGHNFGAQPPRCIEQRCWCLFEGRGPEYDIISEIIINGGLFDTQLRKTAKPSVINGIAEQITAKLIEVQPQE